MQICFLMIFVMPRDWASAREMYSTKPWVGSGNYVALERGADRVGQSTYSLEGKALVPVRMVVVMNKRVGIGRANTYSEQGVNDCGNHHERLC